MSRRLPPPPSRFAILAGRTLGRAVTFFACAVILALCWAVAYGIVAAIEWVTGWDAP